jgi:hypothetical protein
MGAKIRTRISNIYTKKGTKCRRLDIAALQDPGKRRMFSEKLDQKSGDLSEEATSWKHVCDTMNQVAEEVLGLPTRNDWFDDDCRAAVQAVIEARAKGRDSRSKMDKVRTLQREKKKVLRKKKRQFDQEKLADIENLHTINETRKFYQAINIVKNEFHPRTLMCKKINGDLVCDTNGVLKRWKEHFNDVLNAGAEEMQEAPRKKNYESNDGKDISAPLRKEIEDAMSKLKNNKAPGDYSLPGELFKASQISSILFHYFAIIMR